MIWISDTVRISRFDENNLQIEEYVPVTNRVTAEVKYEWKWRGYYGNLKQALQAVLKKLLFNTAREELELNELVDQIKAVEKTVLEAIQNYK